MDAFCGAMIAIRGEIDNVASGNWSADDNPFTQCSAYGRVSADRRWNHPYSRGRQPTR